MPAAVLASTAVAAAGGPAAARDVQRVLANHAGPRQAGGAAHPNKACPALASAPHHCEVCDVCLRVWMCCAGVHVCEQRALLMHPGPTVGWRAGGHASECVCMRQAHFAAVLRVVAAERAIGFMQALFVSSHAVQKCECRVCVCTVCVGTGACGVVYCTKCVCGSCCGQTCASVCVHDFCAWTRHIEAVALFWLGQTTCPQHVADRSHLLEACGSHFV
jgi:hypothetical protein